MIFLNKEVLVVVSSMSWIGYSGGSLRLSYDVRYLVSYLIDRTFTCRHIPFTLNLSHSIIVVGLFYMDLYWLSFVTDTNCRWHGEFFVSPSIIKHLLFGFFYDVVVLVNYFYNVVVGFYVVWLLGFLSQLLLC